LRRDQQPHRRICHEARCFSSNNPHAISTGASRWSSVLRGQAQRCARHQARSQQFLFWCTNERLGFGPPFFLVACGEGMVNRTTLYPKFQRRVCRHTVTTLVSLQLAKYLTAYVWRGNGEPPYYYLLLLNSYLNLAADLVTGDEGCAPTACTNCKYNDHAGTIIIALCQSVAECSSTLTVV
jgi:hypothetical protein